MSSHAEKPFRIIIVGAGITGLAASHALQKANIDHVVLERSSDPAPSLGTSIAIFPHGSRLLEQFGCLEAAKATTGLYTRHYNRMPNGKTYGGSDLWRNVRENHGYDFLLMERGRFLEVLFNSLPDKSRVRLDSKIEAIKEDEEGVEVFCNGGTSERGDIVIGCDGVHSFVRETMWDNAAKHSPGLITATEKKTMTTAWNCLLGMGPGEPGLGFETSAVHNDHYSFLLANQPDKTYWFVFMKVQEPYSTFKRPRYSNEDIEKVAKNLADHPISETRVFGELWKKRWRSVMVDIEEGVLDHWHFGRTVLVGDAAHKITPNIALGGNTGMESVASLVNLINKAVKSHSEGKPSKAVLSAIFQEYQEQRIPRTRKIMKFANMITRVQAWDGIWMKFRALWVLPYQSEQKLAQDLADIIKGGVKLDFVPIEEYRNRKTRWDDEEKLKVVKFWGEGPQSLVKGQQVSLLGMLVILSSALWLTWGDKLVELLYDRNWIGVRP